MEFLQEHYTDLLLILSTVYPISLFLLPSSVASKISIGVKIVKTVADALEQAQNTKGGFSSLPATNTDSKTFIQKSKG